jgi:organic hydroperoxide reductase OsmC/OhrA
MSEEIKKLDVSITLEKEMIFKCELGDIKVEECYIDDTNKDEVNMLGPNPSRLVGLAVLGCLSSSFIFCLKKRDFTLDNLKAEAEVIIGRNKKGFWRVKKINVNIDAKIDDPETRKRADQCRKMFEQYCIVTQAIREGIDVELKVNY